MKNFENTGRHSYCAALASVFGATGGWAFFRVTATLVPGVARCRPSTTTQSPGSRPLRMDMHPNEHPRKQGAILVGKRRTDLQGARGGIDSGVDEIQPPLVGVALLRLQADKDGYLVKVGRAEAPRPDHGADPQHRRLVHVEVHIDGLDLLDGSELGGRRRAHQVPHIHEMAADAAGKGGHHPGVPQVQLGDLDVGLRLIHGGRRGVALREPLLQVRLGACALLHQPRLPGVLRAGAGQLRLLLGERRLGQLEIGLVGRALDDEEQVALLDHRAVLEIHRLQIACHPRYQIDRRHRARRSRQVQVTGYRLDHGVGNRHRRRRRWGVPVAVVAARGQQQRRQHPEGKRSAGANRMGFSHHPRNRNSSANERKRRKYYKWLPVIHHSPIGVTTKLARRPKSRCFY
ncbi:MAG: hypothetical protein P8Y27_20650 [Chromatiaceae bacterium]